MCDSDVLDSVITSVSSDLAARPSIKVVTELQLTIEAMLRAAANPILDERHIPYQIIMSWNAKLHGLHITVFVVISCSSGDLTVDMYLQIAVASLLRRRIHDVIMTDDGPGVLLTGEQVIPVLIKHKILSSTLRTCDSMSAQKWNGRSKRLTEKFYPNLTSKACRLFLGPKTSKERKRYPFRMTRLLLERKIHLYLRVSGRCGKVKAQDGVIGVCRAGLETMRAL